MTEKMQKVPAQNKISPRFLFSWQHRLIASREAQPAVLLATNCWRYCRFVKQIHELQATSFGRMLFAANIFRSFIGDKTTRFSRINRNAHFYRSDMFCPVSDEWTAVCCDFNSAGLFFELLFTLQAKRVVCRSLRSGNLRVSEWAGIYLRSQRAEAGSTKLALRQCRSKYCVVKWRTGRGGSVPAMYAVFSCRFQP